MARLQRIRPDEAWKNGPVVTPIEMNALDGKIAKAVNGDGGGPYSPASPIELRGAGLRLMGPSVLRGARSQIRASALARLELGDDYPALSTGHMGRSRVLRTPCTELLELEAGVARWFHEGSTSASVTYGAAGGKALVRLHVHDGATFVQATFTFIVNGIHAGIPERLPRFRVVRADDSGAVTPLRSSGTLFGGFLEFSPRPLSAAAWPDVVPKVFTYVLDPGVVVDESRFSYFAEIHDESGVNAAMRNFYIDVVSTFDGITDLRPQ